MLYLLQERKKYQRRKVLAHYQRFLEILERDPQLILPIDLIIKILLVMFLKRVQNIIKKAHLQDGEMMISRFSLNLAQDQMNK